MPTIYPIFIFIFGLCVGSFLNVVIYRSKVKKSLARPRSFCPSCKHKLTWLDLIPLFSFLFLLGRCRYCHKKISWQYPLVEFTTGILFVLFYYFSGGLSLFLLLNLILVSLLIIIFVYDLKYYLILDKIILSGLIVSIFRSIFLNIPPFPSALLGSLISGGFFFLIVLFSKGKWMGGGDVKLGFLLGLILGWSQALVALFIAFFLGSIIGVILIILKRKSLKSAVPFGPFLVIGALTSMLYGARILNWYLNLL